MNELLNQIMQRLRTEVPELQTIDVNRGQMEPNAQLVEGVCALVDFAHVGWSNQCNMKQRGLATIELELFLPASQTTSISDENYPWTGNLECYRIASLIDNALQGYRTTFGPLIRTTLSRRKDISPRSTVLTYTCNIGQ